MNHSISLLPFQWEAMMATEPEVLLLGGIGTGKSFLGANWILDKAVRFPGCKLMIVANTYQQLMSASVKTLTQLLDELKIPYTSTLSGARKRIQIGKTLIYLYSLEKPDSIRGIEVDGIWGDEIAFSTKKALNIIRGRLRGKTIPKRQILMTTSPNSFNFLYDEFGVSPGKKKKVIKAKTKENIYLAEGYYEDLLEQYGGEDTPLARQELFGEFVNMQEGAIYNLFDRNHNVVPCTLNKNFPVYVGADFNIDKMSFTYMQMINGILYVCKEVQLTHRDANTYDMGKRILADLPGCVIHVVPDSTGSARKTSTASGKSDHVILKEMGLNLLNTQNPFVRDRQNSVNMMFHKKKLFIDPSCKETIKEIETLSSRDKEGQVSHLAVTVGYVVWKLAPLKPIQTPSRMIQL